jgi:hypothetical protein
LVLQFLGRRRLVFSRAWDSVHDATPGLNGNVEDLIRSYFFWKTRAREINISCEKRQLRPILNACEANCLRRTGD